MDRAPTAIESALKRIPDIRRFNRSAFAGHARLFVHPAYARLVNAEPIVRRLVPVLIILFVVFLGVMRFTAMLDARKTTEVDARADLSLIATATVANLVDMQAQIPSAGATETFQGILTNALPEQATKDGRTVILADPQGQISAVLPRERDLIGTYLDDLLGTIQPLTTLGARAGVLQLKRSDGQTVIATVRHGPGRIGSLAVIQPQTAVFANWRNRVSKETTIFVLTSLVLVLLGFAYHAQTARAQEADFIYQETQNRFHMALRRGHSGLWDWDLARGAIFWSQSMFELLGLEAEQRLLSVGDIMDLMHPDDGDIIDLANNLLRTGNGQIDREFRMKTVDGRWIWLRARGEVVRDTDNHPHLIGIAVDITEQKKLAEASRTADLRLRDAIEAISEAFVLWNSNNKLVACNSKYQQLYGLPDDLIKPGTSYEEIVGAGRRPVIANQLPLTDDADAGARSVEARIEDGRWLQINERRTNDGGFVSVGTDITTLKEHEGQLLENERRLTAAVADLRRSRQQLEKQAQQLLMLADKYQLERNRAEEASRAKSEFLANVSHELRTPLNAIIGFSDMMGSGVFGPLGDEKYEEYCSDIHHSGTFLLSVITDILDMARLEAGKVSLTREELALEDVVMTTVRGLQTEADEAKIHLRVQITPGLTAFADRKATSQILSNLLSNAIKFTPEKGSITVEGRRKDDALVLSVEDNGIGIPKAALRKLSLPFEQAESQFTRAHKGSGLGLAISRSFVELHGGTMEIVSTEGVGTKVTITIPDETEAEEEVEPALTA